MDDNVDFLSNFNPSEKELQATIDSILKQELDGGVVKPFTSSNPSVSVLGGGSSRDENLIFLADWIGVIGKEAEFPTEINKQIFEEFAEKIKQPNGANTWMQVCKNFITLYGFPDFFVELIKNTEKILYNDPDSLLLKSEFNVNPISQISFDIIRYQVKSYLGQFDSAKKILETLYLMYSDVDKQQTLNILYLYFCNSMCFGRFDDAEEAIKRIHSSINMLDNQQKYNTGAWDDWVSVQLVLWYWMNYIPESLIHFTGAFKISNPLFLKQRKRTVIKNISKELIASLVCETYYNEACKKFSELPKIKESE